jgi:hypothetical protein
MNWSVGVLRELDLLEIQRMSDPIKNAIASVPLVPQQKLPPFSVGICSNDPARAQEASFHWHRGLKDLIPESVPVMVANAKSMAEGYNQILAQCPTEFLILSHHDAWPVSLPTYFCGKRLLERMKNVDVLGFAGASRCVGPRWFDSSLHCFGGVVNYPPLQPGQVITPDIQKIWSEGMRPCGTTVWGRPARLVRNIRTMDGYCLVVRTEAAKKIGFDEAINPGGFHGYDQDFVMSAHTAGLRTAVCCDVYISHNSTGSYSQERWIAHIQPFLQKWKGKFDGTITGVGKGAYAYQSGDARLVLLALQEEEKAMQDEIIAP